MMRMACGLIFVIAIVLVSPLVRLTSSSAQTVEETGVVSAGDRWKLSRKTRSALKQIFKDSIVNSQLTTPEQAQVATFRNLFEKTLATRSVDAPLRRQWQQEGWECYTVPDSNVIVVVEQSDQRWGRGLYVIRSGSDAKIVLQAPHRFNDAKTGVIARKIFEEQNIWAVAFNTVHRKELDLAHCQRHYFNAFTEAIVSQRSNSNVLQLHGFTNARKTNAGKSASIIVSDTTKFPGRHARRVAEELKLNFGKSHTRLYPLETRWLGGTNNHQANLMQQLGSTGFLHLEMNPAFRLQLSTSASVREQFFASILTGLGQ